MDVPARSLSLLSCGLLAGALVSLQGCDGLGDLAEQCGLVCPDTGIVEGNVAISGVVSVDSFFSAVVTVRDASASVAASMRAELEGIAASLEIVGYAEMSLDELAGAVAGGLEAKFAANLQGGLTISYQPPKCEANIELAVEAAAECDVEVEPGSIEAKCEGVCEVSAEVAAECEASGTLQCSGTAPNFVCEGTCKGDCQLDGAADCSGSCQGSCEGECSSCTGGVCDVQNGVTVNCNGSCSTGCSGTCELEAAGSCSGRCEGECTYTPAMGGCEAGATAKCDVSAMADVECQGKCEGSVTPPEVSAECQASVDAKAKAEVTCTPPSLSVQFQFAANLDADAQAEFKVWLEGFKTRFAAMAALRFKLDSVSAAVEGLISASIDVVPGAIEQIEAQGGLELRTTIGLGCAIIELDAVGDALGGASSDISGSVSAFAMVSGSVGG
mgnify:CR=1 FL=1